MPSLYADAISPVQVIYGASSQRKSRSGGDESLSLKVLRVEVSNTTFVEHPAQTTITTRTQSGSSNFTRSRRNIKRLPPELRSSRVFRAPAWKQKNHTTMTSRLVPPLFLRLWTLERVKAWKKRGRVTSSLSIPFSFSFFLFCLRGQDTSAGDATRSQ